MKNGVGASVGKISSVDLGPGNLQEMKAVIYANLARFPFVTKQLMQASVAPTAQGPLYGRGKTEIIAEDAAGFLIAEDLFGSRFFGDPAGDINGVAPQVVDEFFATEHAGDHGAGGDADV